MAERAGMTVSELNLIIAEAIRRDPRIHSVTVTGEVSGFRHHIPTGHWYFSLKDAEASISCVMFRQNTFRSRIKPTDGQAVTISGYIDVYPRNGTYQLYATGMREAGEGDQYARLEALKKKLYAEGLFDAARKKTIPLMPRKVAVVTSESGAALQDILNVSAMRNPSIPIVIIPVTVQGENAAAGIAEGIRKAEAETDADVIIVARGGGSAEDLWCFNDEQLARTVAACGIPVVSGVGHEIDTTLCDLAADVRASTPSNAAEIVFPARQELAARAEALKRRMAQAAGSALRKAESRMRERQLRLAAVSPQRSIDRLAAGTREARTKLNHAIRIRAEETSAALRTARTEIGRAAGRRTEIAGLHTARLKERLEAINPFGVLSRGYTLVYSPEGRILPRRESAEAYTEMTIRFADGEIGVTRHE